MTDILDVYLGRKHVGQLVLLSGERSFKKRYSSIEQPYRFSLTGVQLKFSALAETTGGLTIPAGGKVSYDNIAK